MINIKDYSIIEEYLANKVIIFKASGKALIQNRFGLNEDNKCPLGILSIINKGEYFTKTTWQEYSKACINFINQELHTSITEDFANCFTAGFDGNKFDLNWHSDEEAFNMGKKFIKYL